jgi:exodeoxyribonuclease VII small subunit
MSAKKGGERGDARDERQEEPQLPLEERLRRLDEIGAALEGGSVDLEQGLRLLEAAVRHIREADQLLSAAELRVVELVGKPESAILRPVDPKLRSPEKEEG